MTGVVEMIYFTAFVMLYFTRFIGRLDAFAATAIGILDTQKITQQWDRSCKCCLQYIWIKETAQ
jgi:hypothetical protein